MKKLLTYTLLMLAGAVLMPALAHADLQCSTPPYTTLVNVQNANQCAQENGGRLYDTNTKTWQNPSTGAQIYDPQSPFTCVGLPPAYRTSEPSADGSCNAGYKLGQITKDSNGNVTKVQYADGTSDTPGGTVAPPPSKPAAPTTPQAPASSQKITYIPLEPLPGQTLSNGVYTGNFSQLVGLFFNILLSLGAMVAVVTLVFGGITYMVSEIADKKSEAKRRIQTALLGLFLLLTCWLILHEINPNLTTFSLPGIDGPAGQQAPGSQAAAGGPTATPNNTDIINCEGAEVPTGKRLAPNPSGGGYICQ